MWFYLFLIYNTLDNTLKVLMFMVAIYKCFILRIRYKNFELQLIVCSKQLEFLGNNNAAQELNCLN